MKSYTLIYSKIWKQVVAMTVVPAVGIVAFILFLGQYKNINDTVIFIIIYAGFGVIILFTLYVVFKHAMVPVNITLNDTQIEMLFNK